MNVFGIALSGMQAAGAQLNAAANNLANLDTPGYKAQRPDLVELSGGGVAVSGVSTDPTPGGTESDGEETSNVDPANEMMNLSRARFLYSANAAVVRVGLKMTDSLLDMFDNEDQSRDRH